MNIKPIKTEGDYEAALARVMELMDAKADTSEGDSMKKFVGLIIIEGVIFGCARGAELHVA